MIELLKKLNLPKDLENLEFEELKKLADEIREVIIDIVPQTGGHMGTNLGVVELTLAVHKVFDFSKDRLVFDVGHQAYPHKLLTGRYDKFHTLRKKGGVCGFPNPKESKYDSFLTGHAGTSVSSALGMCLGYDAKKTDEKVVAIIGDGSMCGLSFEGFNQAGALKKNMVVILNDNKMAISPTVGAFSKYLNRIRSGELCQTFVKDFHEALHHVPVIGDKLEDLSEKAFFTIRDNLLPPDRFFTELGFRYYGPVDGHDLGELIPLITNLKDTEGPVIIHAITEKGKGAKGADKDPYKFHSPPSQPGKKSSSITYSQCFVDSLIEEAEADESIVAITAAMVQGTKLESFFKKFPDRAIDTGIAEGHAVTMAGGINYTGLKPVVMIYSTFLQRAYDNIMHDICLQEDISAVFAIDRAGLVGDDGASHHGVFDISYLRHLPRMIVIAPKDGCELAYMFKWALKQKEPVAIRYPRGNIPELNLNIQTAEIQVGKPEMLTKGEDVLIVAYGGMVENALEVVRELENEGIKIGLMNLRFVKPLCPETFNEMCSGYDTIITLEDHAIQGGAGSAILEIINENDLQLGKLIRLGIPDKFIKYASVKQQYEEIGLDKDSLVNKVKSYLPVKA
jgi:1-deoxy-D-xylulose-5-phosphate synthase